MPGVDGLSCLEQIAEQWPEIKIVVLSACEDMPVITGALSAGASAYVVKNLMPMDLASVLRQAAGGCVFHAVTGRARTGSVDPEPGQQTVLTPREQSILEAVAHGLTTTAISKQLWVSEHTVKFHLTNIYRKLGVANRAGAIRYALEHHLVAV
jgi:DNA-binding NarL/FixJ family response regulator